MQPILAIGAVETYRIRRRIRANLSSREARLTAPFPSPKHSQANQGGRELHFAKYPKPAIARYGAFSLKKNGENSGAEKRRRSDGVQKFTSSRLRCERNSYHPKSVTPTVPFTEPPRASQ